MAQFGAAFLKPNFHDWDLYLSDMIVTVQIAIWGTTLAVVFGIPFAILSAANVCPQWVVQPVRRLMDACRAINEIVFALMFVVAVGLAAPLVHRAPERRVDAAVDAVEHAIAIHVHRRPPVARRIRIPMRGAADSLNVSVAAAVLLFEARRQRAPGDAQRP